MTRIRRTRILHAILLLVTATWLSASCSGSGAGTDNQNSGSGPPPSAELELTISPSSNYGYVDEEINYDVTCNDATLLPSEYLCALQFVDHAGQVAQYFSQTHEDNYPANPRELAFFEDVRFKVTGDFEVQAMLFGPESLALDRLVDFTTLDELTALVSASAEATTTLRIRDPGLQIKYTTDATGLQYTFTVEWTDSEYFNWLNQHRNADELDYLWRFSDLPEQGSIPMKGNQIEHTFSAAGTYTVEVRYVLQAPKILRSETGIVVGADQTLSISAPEGDLAPNRDYVFTAEYGGVLPENPYYEWDFNDSAGTVGVPFSNQITHAFAGTGNYTVLVSLFTEENGALLGSASAGVTVRPDRAARLLQAMKATGLRASISAQHNFSNQGGAASDSRHCSCSWNGDASGCRVFYCKVTKEQMDWDGRSFSVGVDETLQNTPTDGVTRKRTVDIRGQVSEDSETLMTLSVTEDIADTFADGSVLMSYSQAFDISDVDFSNITGLAIFLGSPEPFPALPASYQIQGCVYGAAAPSHVDNLALDCLVNEATPWDYSYSDTDWPEGSNFCVTFTN